MQTSGAVAEELNGGRKAKLVLLVLRGGMDGLGTLAPTDDPSYVADRAMELKIGRDGQTEGIPVQGGPGGFDWRLHKEAKGLAELYRSGRLGFVHAVGTRDVTRSHFVAQELLERGIGSLTEAGRIKGGWITRWLAGEPGTQLAWANGSIIPEALSDHPDVLCAPNLRDGFRPPGGTTGESVISAAISEPKRRKSSPGTAETAYAEAATKALRSMRSLDDALRTGDGKIPPYLPSQGVSYDDSPIGKDLSTVAQLLRIGKPNIRAFCVSMAGWDTHENQSGRLSSLVGQLSRAVSSFVSDVEAVPGGVLLIATSEFGRRLRSNKSNGTDHGRGGLAFAVGPGVAGGRIHGKWPGLDETSLDGGVDLRVATDARAIFAEALAGPLGGRAVDEIFPGLRPERIGLFV
jgi:uncharacterized protein (DUF1501 family)